MGMPGELYVINHLRSEKGQKMNGRRAVAVGVDPPSAAPNRRVQVRLLDASTNQPTGKVLQIKPKNLVDAKHYCSAPSKPTLSKDDALDFLNKAWKNGITAGHAKTPQGEQARDSYLRMKLCEECLPDRLPDRKIECLDLLIPADKLNDFEGMKALVTPACIGDGYVDFTRFGEGLIVGKQQEECEECVICQDDIITNLIRLPCGHDFHRNCVRPWIEQHNTCPKCRASLPHPIDTYIFNVPNQQIQTRFDEWFLSGMCEKCQAVSMENNPVVQVTLSGGEKVTMPLRAAEARGYTNYESVQGHGYAKQNILGGF